MKPVWKTERLWKSASPMWPNHFGLSRRDTSRYRLGTTKPRGETMSDYLQKICAGVFIGCALSLLAFKMAKKNT
jgi:hypothetical protein